MTAVDPSGFLILACLAGLVVLLVAARAGRRPVERSEPAPAPDPAAGGVYFVTANVWLIAGLVLLLGGSTLYGSEEKQGVVCGRNGARRPAAGAPGSIRSRPRPNAAHCPSAVIATEPLNPGVTAVVLT